MHNFSQFALRKWLEEDGWHQGKDSYSTLTHSSRSLLDFPVPDGLSLSVSKSPSDAFASSAVLRAYSAAAAPQTFLTGTIGYLSSSLPLNLASSSSTPLKRVVDHFFVPALPTEPLERPIILQGGERVDKRSTFLYGCFHAPTGRLDGLAATRLSRTWLGMVSLISLLPSTQQKGLANVVLNLQHNTGTWASDYSYSLDDGLVGCRALYHFKARDEERGEGLRGRFSAGGEVFFSAKTKSAGLSTGIRFTTLPEHSGPLKSLSQPPTIATFTVNPIMGHFSAAYAAQVGRSIALCSRYDFNVHSLLSELSVGGEWLQRRRDARGSKAKRKDASGMARSFWRSVSDADEDVISIIKARVSTSSEVGLAWETKLANCLCSVGVTLDVGRSKPLHAFGASVQYFSSG